MDVTSMGLDAYTGIVGREEIAEIRRLGESLGRIRVQHVNSTLVGGGVAEILARLVPLMQEVGLDARWDVITGDAPFFGVTKMFHNALHGAEEPITPEAFDIFRQATARNLGVVDHEADVVAIHDPQPIGLVSERNKRRADQRWVWRCHIDLSDADLRVWGFLRPHVEQYDAAIFHLPDYAKEVGIPQVILAPAIDPLTEKNRDLPPDEIRKTLEDLGIDPRRPIVLQVSRFDRLKDPVGVVQAWRLARRWHDCQLVLAGGSASDDPEGERVLAEVREAAGKEPDVHVLNLPPDAHRTINALQRGATVVIQKSLREGFGLVVTEAMWKGKPVIGGAVGGIRKQILHEQTGFLVHTVEGTAFRIRQLLGNPGMARRLGENAKLWVRDNFLLTRYLKNWLLVLHALRAPKGEGVVQLP